MKVNFKRLSDTAVLPTYAIEGAAGMDLTASSVLSNNSNHILYGTGISVDIPSGYVGLIFPRSSVRKTSLSLSNSVGVIDHGYTGEIQFTFNRIDSSMLPVYNVGDRIGQLVILPIPSIEVVEVDEHPEYKRGENGFGSTGK